MLQCIFGQIEVLSRYKTKLTTTWYAGVVLTTDYEIRFEILKKVESRGLNKNSAFLNLVTDIEDFFQ